jgi:hypothetical protein
VHNANPQIYGHLSRSRVSQGIGCLHLSGRLPILYSRTRLALGLITPPDHYLNTESDACSTHGCRKNGRSKVRGYSYIPVPDDDEDYDEDEYCLRMKRCGALLVVPGDDSLLEPQGRVIQAGERQIFGWPSAGGVWIYRILPEGLRLEWGAYDSDIDWLEAAATVVERGEPEIEALEELELEIRAQTDMEGVGRVLKNAGAMYYENIEECSEVLDLSL